MSDKGLVDPHRILKICCVIPSYWVISISLVFANKLLVGSVKSDDSDVTVFVAWIQCMVTVTFIYGIKLCKVAYNRDFRELRVNTAHLRAGPVLVMTVTYVAMLSFNNFCLRHVSVSFYQVSRSMTLIFVVILSYLLLKKAISLKVCICCVLVAGGFVLGVDQEQLLGTISVSGVVYGLITSVFVALNGIYTKKAMEVTNKNSMQLTLLNNINAILLFCPIVLFSGQAETMYNTDHYHTVQFWGFLILTGVMAFSIAWISAIQIDLTSALTHHISANLKSVVQTVIAVSYNHEEKTVFWWFSMLMVVGGALAYAAVRLQEEKEVSDTAEANKKYGVMKV